MSLLKNIFGNNTSSEASENIHWIPLTSLEMIDTIIAVSETQTVAIFKHSTRCGISKMVKKQFEKGFTLAPETIQMYYLDLLNHRDISTAIATKLNIQHESPQLLVLKNRAVVAYDSHYGIVDLDLDKHI